MTDIERQESGCPFRLCNSNNGDYCIMVTRVSNVTGFEMCAVDWESCPDYQEIMKKDYRAKTAQAEK